MSLAEPCAAEVRDLHAFLEAWFAGEVPRAGEPLARLERALGAGFRLVGPDGAVRSRGAVIDDVDAGYGSRADDDAFRIAVEAVEPRFERDGVCLVTYAERQRRGGVWRTRRSTALFERADDAPGGVVWRHLHETWSDGDAGPRAGPSGGARSSGEPSTGDG